MKRMLGAVLLAGTGAANAQGLAPTVPVLPGTTVRELASSRAANEPRKQVFYVVGPGKLSPTPTGNSARVEFSFRDSVSGSIRQYYPSGKLSHAVNLAHIRRGIKHGVETTWSEAGQMLTRQEFQAGQAEGDFTAHFPDGKVERRIAYHQNHIVSIECFNRKGEPKNCISEEVPPEYAGGAEGLATDLRKLIHYPEMDLRDGREGKLMVNFGVDATGKIGAVRILNSPSQAMYDAVVTGLLAAKRFRKPGLQENQAVPVTMMLEVGFEKRKSGKGVVSVIASEHGFFPPYNEQP